MWTIKKGKLSEENWRKVIRSADSVHKVTDKGKSMMGVDYSLKSRLTDISNEVVKWRAHLRFHEYLSCPSPHVLAIDNTQLNPELEQFQALITKKRLDYFKMARTVGLKHIRYKNVEILEKEPSETIHGYEEWVDDEEL